MIIKNDKQAMSRSDFRHRRISAELAAQQMRQAIASFADQFGAAKLHDLPAFFGFQSQSIGTGINIAIGQPVQQFAAYRLAAPTGPIFVQYRG